MSTARMPTVGALPDWGISTDDLTAAWKATDAFLADLPGTFGMDAAGFYSVLSLRNTSGFIGEVFKHAVASRAVGLALNPHADGRPDLLDVRAPEAARFLTSECIDSAGGPLRARLAPFPHGGVEVKCSIGKSPKGAGEMPPGVSRRRVVKGLTYWAHHRHACNLLGVYYDFDEAAGGAPQIKAIFMAPVEEDHWQRVSTGRPDRKKTSNTSLTSAGVSRVVAGLVAFDPEPACVEMLERIGAPVS